MLIRKSLSFIYIQFEAEDWDSGFARKAIELIKEIPMKFRRYYPDKKEWGILSDSHADKLLEKFKECKNVNDKVNYNDYDINEFLIQFD